MRPKLARIRELAVLVAALAVALVAV